MSEFVKSKAKRPAAQSWDMLTTERKARQKRKGFRKSGKGRGAKLDALMLDKQNARSQWDAALNPAVLGFPPL